MAIGNGVRQALSAELLANVSTGKNFKEAFLKKIQICMKIYDYMDETKDVKGKVSEPERWSHNIPTDGRFVFKTRTMPILDLTTPC